MRKTLIVLHDVVLTLLVEAVSLLLAPFVPIVALFAKWDKHKTTWSGGNYKDSYPAIRGDLPKWAYIWSTPDERLPGDMWMPQTRSMLEWTTGVFGEKVGRYLTSVWWLLRNRTYGLTWITSATPFETPIRPSDKPGIVWVGGLWRWWMRIGPISIHAGWKVHRANVSAHWIAGPFVAVRFISFKKVR